jgi:hypothetical protein
LMAPIREGSLLVNREESFEDTRSRCQPAHTNIIRCMVGKDWVYFK